MYCVIQEIERKTVSTGEPKELEVYTYKDYFDGETIYSYRNSEERFERPIKKAYKISLHQSYRENGKVKKKQYNIITCGHYELIEDLYWYDIDKRIEKLADKLNIETEILSDLVYKKLNPLYERLRKEYEQTEEYKTSQKHSEILRKYREAEREFQSKYNSKEFNKCYDLYLNLRNKDKLDQIIRQYEENQEYQRKSREYQEREYKKYYEQYSNYNSSGYQANNDSNYKDDTTKEFMIEIIKAGYKKLASKYHPDKGGKHEDMQRLNKAKEELDKIIN